MKIRIDEIMKALDGKDRIDMRFRLNLISEEERDDSIGNLFLSFPTEVYAELDAELDKVQKRCSERTLTAREMMKYTMAVRNKYSDFAKKTMKGTKVIVNPFCDRFPNAYKYKPMGTCFTMEHDGKGWIITNICREDTNKSSTNQYKVFLTEECKAEVMKRVERFDF